MNLEGKTVGNYLIGAELGRGGMGTVHRATVVADGTAGSAGTTVAVKFFHPHLVAEDRALERFRREAEVGMRIRHANVVRTFEIGSEQIDGATCPYMAMEFIAGQTLRDLVKELGTVPEHLLYQIADQVLDALAAVHEAKVVHRDIKPENIVITREHRVLLMDLGVARLQDQGREMTQAGEFLGSIPYAAPEQFLDIESVGPRTDLYAFGAVLYELATGHNPFGAPDIPSILRQKLDGEVARPRSLVPDIAPFFEEVILTCLQKEPSARFGSASEMRKLLQEGERSEWWRGRTQGVAAPAADRALRRLRLPREAPLVGRRVEIDRLRQVYAAVQGGQGRYCLVPGATGSGKSRLVYQFLEETAAAGGPLIAAGRCVGSGGRSYQPFVEAAHDLLGIEEMDPANRRVELEERLGGLLADTPGIVGPMAEFLLGGLQPGADPSFSPDALVSAWANLLRALARDRPVIVVLEDCHLAGPETIDLFTYLTRLLAGQRLLLITVYRDDEIEDGSPLQALITGSVQRPEAAMLVVPALAPQAVEELLRAVVRHDRTVRALLRPILEKCEGNPLILFEMLAHLRANGILREEGEGLAVTGSLTDVELPSTLKDIIALRLARIDEEHRETLDAAAILGYEFQASLLASVVEEKRLVLLKRLAVLERKYRMIRSSGRDGFRFVSRQIYESVYASINPSLRSEYHSVVADAIAGAHEGEDPLSGEPAYALVRHLMLAERPLEAEPHVEAALAHLIGGYHASYAAPFLEKLLAALTEGRPEKRFALAMGLWHFYELLGRRDDQMRTLRLAAELADQLGAPGPRGQVHSCLGVSHWRLGDFANAEKEAAQGLALAKEAGDRKWESNSLHTLGVVAWRRGEFERCADLWREGLAIRREIADRRGVASSLQALGAVFTESGDHEQALACKRESLEIFRSIGDRRGECALLNNVGNSLVQEHALEEALQHFEKAVTISRELGDLPSEAFPLNNLGRLYYLLGRVEESRRAFERALDIFHETGNRSGEVDTRLQFASLLDSIGSGDDAVAQAEAARELAEGMGARHLRARAHRFLGKALHNRGAMELARAHLDQALALGREARNTLEIFESLGELGLIALDEARGEEACRLLEESLQALESAKHAPALAALALSRLARAQMAAGRADPARKSAERAAEKLQGLQGLGDEGPEICWNLAGVFQGEERGRTYITTASDLLAARARAMSNEAHREHYLTRIRLNREILALAGR